MKIKALALCAAMLLPLAGAAPSSAEGGKTKSAIPGIRNMAYKPVPAIESIPLLPDPAEVPEANPTGNYNAYDLNVFETIHFPFRQPGDETEDDAPGGALAHGTCAPEGCANHGLEFVDFWQKTFKPLVAPFGGFTRAYAFASPGSEVPPYVFAQPAGVGYNLQAVIPGATHPEQMVIVSGHYDQTESGPASAWDSAEGHATVFRIAKIMTDYWKRTGTRPAATVKFSAWSAEESGSHGSKSYVNQRILPFPNLTVNAYFNLDPCAGAYPAYYRGNPANRIPMVMQLANPEDALSPVAGQKMEAFNKQARDVLGDVMNHLDDTLTDVPTAPEIFVSDEEAARSGVASQESEIVTAVGGLRLFSSDYANFDNNWPIFNLFPDVFGLHDDGTPGRVDGITILHTPQDNLRSLNALTGIDQSGLTPSEGWYKGLEFCAHMHGWFMLQPNMGGAEPRDTRPVAYFEVLPTNKDPYPSTEVNPLKAGQPLAFSALGSYSFSNASAMFKAKSLKYSWSFGDGGRATGLEVQHSYKQAGSYIAKLTVTAPGGAKDTMPLYIKVT